MKKILGLTVLILSLTIVFGFSAVYAKTYKVIINEAIIPNNLGQTQKIAIGNVFVEIPDNAILPKYFGRLEYIRSGDSKAFDNSPLIVNYYQDPEFRYVAPDGDEIFPFVELLKRDKNSASYKVIALFLVNDENEVEGYIDETAMAQPATGKLEKDISYNKPVVVQKIPREK